ncbi:MAG TPA: HlyD family secretion protein [Verrucomicrobiae bacterium]|jgi:membrane fusion protein (multidrug efflux system)|nr:HlyD family secretion protein [Verrucomicrobiae bacterium]
MNPTKDESTKTPRNNHDSLPPLAEASISSRSVQSKFEKQASGGEEPPAGPKRLRLFLTCAVALILALAAGAYYYWCLAPYESTDDATIDGHVTAVAPQISGRVTRVLVQDNQEVKQGDLLLEIDPKGYETKLSQAKANLTSARSQLAQARAQAAVDQAKVEQERASLAVAQAQAGYAEGDWKRYQSIGKTGVSQSQIDLAETQAHSSAAQVDVARSKITAAEAQAALSQASIDTAAANVEQTQAAVSQAELELSYTKVSAPESGHVTHRTVEPGAYAQTGQALLAIVPHAVWVVANFKETQLTHMRAGQPVTIKMDAYPGNKFTGHVDSIQTGSGARFSLFPPENATGNYIKVLQRVPVKIVFDESSLLDSNLVLGPGMSVEPKVRVK